MAPPKVRRHEVHDGKEWEMNKAVIRLLFSFAMALLATGSLLAQNLGTPVAHPHIKGITAVTEVFGNGQKLTAAAIEYDQAISTSKLVVGSFSVAGRTIVKVYANSRADKATQGVDGNFVILELAPDDAGSATFSQRGPSMNGPPGGGAGPGGPPPAGGPGNNAGAPNAAGVSPRNMSNGAKRTPAKVSVTQAAEIIAASGKRIPADPIAAENSKIVNLVVDDFTQHTFTDAVSGEKVPYNLFVPKNYDQSKTYPLIIFIHDAGVLSTQPDTTLLQGLGAIIWATPSEQAKHPAFVLAPQFDRTPAGGSLTDITVNLIKSVMAEYHVDSKRIYTTGQSLGCTLSMEMMLKYPDFFAAAMLVAGQIEDTPRTAGLAHAKFWITVSEGDLRAFPTMNTSLPIMEAAGAKVARGRWSAKLSGPELLAKDKQMEEQNTNILYTVFEKGTTFPPGFENSKDTEHMGTWQYAYLNEGIRDWLFRQSR